MKKYIYLLSCFYIAGCSVQNSDRVYNRPRPNITEAFKCLDQFIVTVPMDEFSKNILRASITGSSEKTNMESETIENKVPACYFVQYHLNTENDTLIVNYIFYTNDTTIESHTVTKYKLQTLNNNFTFKNVNDNYSELPESFYKNYTVYGATPIYHKYKKWGEKILISTGIHNPSATTFNEYFAIKISETSFSLMQFPWNVDYATDHIILLYNGPENSIDEDLAKWGTTPSQAADIKFGKLDIPHLIKN